MIKHCADTGSPVFGVVLISRGSEVGGDDVRTGIGTAARIQSCIPMPGNRFALTCRGEERIRVDRWLPDDPYPLAEIEPWPDVSDGDDSDALATISRKRSELELLVGELAKRSGKPIPQFAKQQLPADPSARSFALAAGLPIADADRQRALAATGPVARLGVLEEALDDVIATVRFRLL
jgi:Lon protease-like protein